MGRIDGIFSKSCFGRWNILIFITLGTQKFPFNRLLEYIDIQVEEKNIEEDVFAQIGNSTYIPQNYKYKRFIDRTEFENLLSDADIIITHAGVGTIISAVNNKKKTIIQP